MRRFPLIAASALLAAGVVAVTADSASAGKPPSFTTQNQTIAFNPSEARCEITLNWAVSDPSGVQGYLVQANNLPLTRKNGEIQGDTITDTTSHWFIDNSTAFYMKVTIILASGKESKSWSVGSDSWSCTP